MDDIWSEYDVDNSNTLDKEETRRFIRTTLIEFSGGAPLEHFSDEDFENTFAMFDEDQNGTIDKAEMVRFIRKISGMSVGRMSR